jgi:hypothetical protein
MFVKFNSICVICQVDEGNSIPIELTLSNVPFLSENSRIEKFKGIVNELLLGAAIEVFTLQNKIK